MVPFTSVAHTSCLKQSFPQGKPEGIPSFSHRDRMRMSRHGRNVTCPEQSKSRQCGWQTLFEERTFVDRTIWSNTPAPSVPIPTIMSLSVV